MPRGSMVGKVLIEATIVCVSGLHVGGSTDAIEIGGLDMPVVRDPVTNEPYIPGSSVKGKLRSLMEKRRYTEVLRTDPGQAGGFFNRSLAPRSAPVVRHHECSHEECIPCRIFGVSRGGRDRGSANDDEGRVEENRPARLLVRDCWLLNADMLSTVTSGLFTEIKHENALDRITSEASPRQLERVPRGARFSFKAVYTVDDPLQVKQDLKEIAVCLRLVEDDYLGGCGSRGCGEVKFEDVVLRWRPQGFYEGTQGETTGAINLAAAQLELDEAIERVLGG